MSYMGRAVNVHLASFTPGDKGDFVGLYVQNDKIELNVKAATQQELIDGLLDICDQILKGKKG